MSKVQVTTSIEEGNLLIQSFIELGDAVSDILMASAFGKITPADHPSLERACKALEQAEKVYRLLKDRLDAAQPDGEAE